MKKLFNTLLLSLCIINSAFAANAEQIILNDINAYRAKHGLTKLKMDAAISREAKNHSQDMAENIIPFGHEGFNKRMQRIFKQFERPYGIAENVAYNYANADKVVNQWLDSAGHRKNILGSYNLTGIGIAHGKQGRVYVTQIFLRG